MRKTASKIVTFFYRLWYFRKIKRFAGYEKVLSKAVTDKEVDQMILKYQIVEYMRRYMGIDVRSKYIPKTYRNIEESRQQVLGRFGKEMERLNITINEELALCTQ